MAVSRRHGECGRPGWIVGEAPPRAAAQQELDHLDLPTARRDAERRATLLGVTRIDVGPVVEIQCRALDVAGAGEMVKWCSGHPVWAIGIHAVREQQFGHLART